MEFKRTPHYLSAKRKKTPARAQAGQPTKLNERVIKDIAAAISSGHYVDSACKLVNVSKFTFGRWLRRGREEYDREIRLDEAGVDYSTEKKSLHYRLYIAIQSAMFKSEDADLQRINAAGASGIWQAAAWKLERRHAQRWAKRSEQNLNIQSNSTVTVRRMLLVPKRAATASEWEEKVKDESGEALVIDNDSGKVVKDEIMDFETAFD